MRRRICSALRWVADYLDGGDYYCEHWSILRDPHTGQQRAVWSDSLAIAGQTPGMPLYSRKDEQHLEG